jgi:autotransporter-associated beta strand protein
MTLEVGHLGTDSEWNGVFADQVSESNMAHFTKVGAGKLTLGGNNEYRGVTSVNEGTLIVNGNPTGGGAYNVASGATLGGTGNLGSSAVNIAGGGTLAPGASIGTFGVGGATINGALQVQYDGDVDTIDLLNVAGLLDITNATVNFQNLGAGALDGGPHVFATYGSLMGAGVGMDEFSMMSGLPSNFAIDYHYLGNQIALVASSGLPGDFNQDDVVDAADYVLWRKDPTNPANGYISDPSDGYNLWRANFGNPPGSGSSLNGSGAVPEPASIGLVALGILFLVSRRSDVRR